MSEPRGQSGNALPGVRPPGLTLIRHARRIFAQMTCEKYLKALTVQNSNEYADNSHKLLELEKLCEQGDPNFAVAETSRLLEFFRHV
jgi:hypothetical protein